MIRYLIRLLLSYIIDDKTPEPKVGEYWVFNEYPDNPFDQFILQEIKDVKGGYVQYGKNDSMSIRKFKCMFRRSVQ